MSDYGADNLVGVTKKFADRKNRSPFRFEALRDERRSPRATIASCTDAAPVHSTFD